MLNRLPDNFIVRRNNDITTMTKKNSANVPTGLAKFINSTDIKQFRGKTK